MIWSTLSAIDAPYSNRNNRKFKRVLPPVDFANTFISMHSGVPLRIVYGTVCNYTCTVMYQTLIGAKYWKKLT